MAIEIRNGRVIDPSQGIDEVRDLFVEQGTIVEALGGTPDRIIDAAGKWVVPGLIDGHVHLREPGGEQKETILTGVAAAAAGGFTTVIAMPNTNPCADNADVIRLVMDKAAALRSTRVIQSCAITIGRQGTTLTDFEKVVKACGVTLFTDDGDGVASDEVMTQAFKKAARLGITLAQHSEFAAISKKAAIHEGDVSSDLKISGQPIAAEDDMVRRDIDICRRIGGHLHVSHISSKNAIEMVRAAKKEGLNVTAEVTPHHLHLTDQAVYDNGCMAKVAPPLRPNEHVVACRTALLDGTIDVVATDHAPHTFDDKTGTIDQAAFGMVGLEVAVPLLLLLVEQGALTPGRMIEAMSTAPARLFGLEGGTLKVGSVADLAIIDPDKPYEIDPCTFRSKGQNTPFAGTRVPGRAVLTMVAGKVVFEG